MMKEAYCSNPQESQWIDLARAGDLSAFNQLVLANQDVAFRTAIWLVNDEACAEDIVQTVFLAAYREISTFRSNNFRPWLLRMIRNACIDELRRRKRHPYLSMEAQDADGETAGRYQLPIDAQETPEETFIQRENWEWIKRSLHQLPEHFREVIFLIDMEGLDYLEAANILSIPLGTIKSRLGRARARMRHILNQDRQRTGSLDGFTIPIEMP